MRRFTSVLLALTLSGMAVAATPPSPTIDSAGSGVVEVAPDFVEFWIHQRGTGKSLAESAEGSQGFEPALRKELETRQLTASALEFSNLAIPNAANLTTFRSAKLRFSAVAFKNNEEGPKQFAKLCDDILAVALALKCEVDGPLLGVENTKSVEQAAVTLATEKAYPGAEAIAIAMKTQIIGIESASVVSLVWNQDAASKAQQPDIRRLTCTAKVRIWYLYAVPQGG
ncbi:MAG: hypothetical protein HZB26_17665 [Candidatus Hydrogenedentes bacterium]|nr:hypothetical protein [Candidatus Hydrogenedentota bacterium]